MGWRHPLGWTGGGGGGSRHCWQPCRSVAQACLTLCDPGTAAHLASLSFPTSWSLLKLMSFVSVMSSNHLILCRPLLLPSIFPSIRIFSNESSYQVAKVLELQLQYQSFQRIFRIDFL